LPARLLLAACAGGGGTETVRVGGSEYAYVTPKRIDGGVVSMEFANAGKEPHRAELTVKQPRSL
jgi:hypothetical protein